MRIGEIIKYKGYHITKHLKDDYVVEVGHDTLEFAKGWIDRVIKLGELEEIENDDKAHNYR